MPPYSLSKDTTRNDIIDTDFTNFFKNGEFVVTTLEEFFDLTSEYNANPYIPHRLTFFAIIFFIDGEGSHHVDFANFQYEGASLFFICKGQVHSFNSRDNLNGYILYFTEDFANRSLEGFGDKLYYHMFNYALSSPYLSISKDEGLRKDFISMFEMMHREYKRDEDCLSEEIIRCQLRSLFNFAQRGRKEEGLLSVGHKGHDLFIRLQKLIDKNVLISRNSDYYCDNLNVCYRKLNDTCKEFTGQTLRHFIDDRLILEIKRQLVNCDHSIKEICYNVGFEEPSNMTKFFKSNTGMLPKEFRAQTGVL